MASPATTTANTPVGSIRRSFIGGIHFAASKPATGAARLEWQSSVANAVTGAMPLDPRRSASLNSAVDEPNAETTPRPETTT